MAFFMANYRRFFFGGVISSLLSGLENYFISSHGLKGITLQVIIILALSVVALKKIQAEWVHKLFITVWVLAIIASIVINCDVWLIT
jgi:hypothetical protein